MAQDPGTNNPEALYQSPQNTGYATVLSSDAPSLFDIMDDLKSDRQAAEKARKEAEKAKADELAEFMKYNPEKIWEPYNNYQQEMYDNYVNEAAKVYGKEGQVTAEEKARLYKMKQEIVTVTNKMNSFKTTTDKMYKEIIDDPSSNVDKEKLSQHIAGIYLDAEGGLIRPEDMGSEMITEVLSDYNYYDQRKVAQSILDNIKDNTETEIYNNRGLTYTNTNTYKNGFVFELEPDGQGGHRPAKNEDGSYKFEITPALVSAFMNDDEGALMVKKIQDQHQALGETITATEAVHELVSPDAYFDQKRAAKTNSLYVTQQRQAYQQTKPTKPTEAQKVKQETANVWFQNIDQLLTAPIEDTSKSPMYSIDAQGQINTSGRGNILLPADSQLIGVKVGKHKSGTKMLDTTIEEVVFDPITDKTYYKTSQRTGGWKELNRTNVAKLLQQIQGLNSQYKDYVGYGRNNGYLVDDPNTNELKFAQLINENDNIKNRRNAAKQQAERINLGIKQFQQQLAQAISITTTTGDKSQINAALKAIPSGVELKLEINGKTETYSNPEITVAKATISDYIYIDGVEFGKMTEENFRKIISGLRVSRDIAAKAKASTSNTQTNKKTTTTTTQSTSTGGAY